MLRFFAMLLGSKARKTSPTRRASQRARTILGVEELTPRVLPNATPMSLAGGHLCGQSAHAAVSDPSSTGTSSSNSSTASMAGDPCAAGATLVANLTDASGATGQASFNATTGTLKVTVQGATTSTSLPVTVDGTSVGSVTTGTSGAVRQRLATSRRRPARRSRSVISTGTFTQAKLTASLTGAHGGHGQRRLQCPQESVVRLHQRGRGEHHVQRDRGRRRRRPTDHQQLRHRQAQGVVAQ